MTQPGDFQCWRKIGVWGLETPKCERLEEHVHCRNCPVFLDAGRAQYDREIEPGYLQRKTEEVAVPLDTDSKGALDSVMSFRVGTESLSLPTRALKEVLQPLPVHTVPHTRSSLFLGLASHHGRLRLCFSFHQMLGTTPTNDQSRSLMLALVLEEEILLFPVDRVDGISKISTTDITAHTSNLDQGLSAISRGLINNGKTTLLDEKKLLQKVKGSLKRS